MTTDNAAFWDKLARGYAAKPMSNVPAYEMTMDRTRNYLKPSDKVLEIGCGSGSTALLLSTSVEHIWASDISGEMVEIGKENAAEQKIENATFIKGDVFAEALEAPAPYDAILGYNVVHLLDDVPASLKRMHAMIKPGGYLITKTVCLSGIYGLFRLPVFLMQLVGKAPKNVHFIAPAKLERLIKDAGFEIEESGKFLDAKMQHFVVARKL